MNSAKPRFPNHAKRWVEPELLQPFVFGVLGSLTLAEFARGALTLSLLPTYGRTVLHFAVEWTALALSVHYLVDNLLRPVSGWFADKFGQRNLLLAGFASSTVALAWMMHVHTFRDLLLSAALYGLGTTPMWPCAVSGIGRGTPQAKRATFMGYLYIFWLLGTGMGPILINFVIGRTYQLAFWLLVLVNVIGFATTFLLVHAPSAAGAGVSGARGAQAPKGAGADASGAAAPSAADPTSTVVVPLTRESARTPGTILRKQAYWRDMWRNVREMSFLFPGMFAQTFAVASLIPILSLFARVKLNISGAMYSSVLITGGALTIALLIPAGKLVDRFGPRRFLVPGFLVAGASLGLYPFRHTLLNTFLFVVVLGVSYAFILPAWNWVLDHSIDPDKKGALWGVFMTVEGAGAVVGPYVGGLMWDRVGPLAPFWLSSLVIIMMGLLYMVLPITGKKAPKSPSHPDGTSLHKFKRRGESP